MTIDYCHGMTKREVSSEIDTLREIIKLYREDPMYYSTSHLESIEIEKQLENQVKYLEFRLQALRSK